MQAHFTSLYWNQFQCEICKSTLPYVFMHKDKKYPLIDFPKIQTDHLILESVSLENKHSRMVHVLHPKKDQLYGNGRGAMKRYLMGRGQDCDLKMSDISVSRNHCAIIYQHDKFWLQDSNSKFGTLVLSKGPVEVVPNTLTCMQIGRNLMLFQVNSEEREPVSIGDYIKKKDVKGKSVVVERRQRVLKQIQNKNKPALKIDGKFEVDNLNFDEYVCHIEKDNKIKERFNAQLMDCKRLENARQQL